MPKKEWKVPQGRHLNGPIKKIVVLMLENRGFDHVMGWLYRADEPPPNIIRRSDGDWPDAPFMGLDFLDLESNDLLNPYPKRIEDARVGLPVINNANADGSQGASPRGVKPKRGARSPKTPPYNPGEQFQHIMNQMWGGQINGTDTDPDQWLDADLRRKQIKYCIDEMGGPFMNGYVRDYDAVVARHFPDVRLTEGQLGEIMDTYTPEQLPVLSGLARFYGVSDEWFCSVPTQTNANRAFSMAGTSRGMVNNSFHDATRDKLSSWKPLDVVQKKINAAHHGSNMDEMPSPTNCLFNNLSTAGVSWMVAWQMAWPPTQNDSQYVRRMFPDLQQRMYDDNFFQFDAGDLENPFYKALRTGNLPAVTWIEPKWGGGERWGASGQWDAAGRKQRLEDLSNLSVRGVGNDYHPVCDTTVAEDFVMQVYKNLSARADWDDTLLVITFDENGGTYDHMMPPPAPLQPEANKVNSPDGYLPSGTDPRTRTQFGFEFDQFGVRVPTLLISPRIPKNLVFRSPAAAFPMTEESIPFDHTSLIATIMKMAEIPLDGSMFSERVKRAPTFEHFIRNDKDVYAGQTFPRQDACREPTLALTVWSDNDNIRNDQPRVRLLYNKPYRLQYIGNPWPSDDFPQTGVGDFVGTSKDLPCLGLQSVETCIFVPLAMPVAMPLSMSTAGLRPDPKKNGMIMNMSNLLIGTSDPSRSRSPYLTVRQFKDPAFYSDGRPALGNAVWQIRVLSSRDPYKPVEIGDWVYFVTRWMPTGGDLRLDPLLRLAPLFDGSVGVQRLTAGAGEWSLWKVVAAD